MTRTIRAHFDGEFIVPDEPVDLPSDEPLQVQISTLSDDNGRPRADMVETRLRNLAKATGCLSGPSVPSDALRREHLYE